MRVVATPSGDSGIVEARYEDLGNVGTLENPSKTLFDALSGPRSFSGLSVTPMSAVTGTIAVYACVSLLAERIGTLPVRLYRRLDENRRELVPEDPQSYPGRLARLLHQSPNPEMTGPELWQTAVGHRALWGNAYFNVVRSRADGRPLQLWPLRPDWTEPMRDTDGQRFYRTFTASGDQVDLYDNEVLHVRTLVLQGDKGLSPIAVARNAVGIEQAAAQYAGRFYANSAVPGGIIKLADQKFPGTEKIKMVRRAWQDTVGGLTNAQRVGILWGGADWMSVGIPPEDAQFIETRKFQVVEIARLFRIPPHMVGDVERSTSWGTGIAEQTVGLVVFNFSPIMVTIEAAVNRDLGLPDRQPSVTLLDEGLYAAFDVGELLRGDPKTHAETNAILKDHGVMNTDEWRADYGWEPIGGVAGKGYTIPSNFNVLMPGDDALPPPPTGAAGNGRAARIAALAGP